MLIWGIVGVIVGLVLGLTGAGGALIAIPLFIDHLGYTVAEATYASVLVVSVGALTNYLFGQDKADYKIVVGFWLFSLVGSYLTALIKKDISEYVVIGLILAITLFSLYKIWTNSKGKERDGEAKLEVEHYYIKIVIAGIILGSLTTITGLGGGVLIIPILISFFNFSYQKAIPTSLLMICIVSFFSFVMQSIHSTLEIKILDVLLLIVGVLFSVFVLKFVLKKLTGKQMIKVRQISFSLVAVYVLFSVGSKLLA
jgi:uncharacterized membrane protein YfcA